MVCCVINFKLAHNFKTIAMVVCGIMGGGQRCHGHIQTPNNTGYTNIHVFIRMPASLGSLCCLHCVVFGIIEVVISFYVVKLLHTQQEYTIPVVYEY